VNADFAAGFIAGQIESKEEVTVERLLFFTDIEGVKDGPDGKVYPTLTLDECSKLIEDGTISGGMIPKVRMCVEAVESGVKEAVILDGRQEGAVLKGVQGGNCGTVIKR